MSTKAYKLVIGSFCSGDTGHKTANESIKSDSRDGMHRLWSYASPLAVLHDGYLWINKSLYGYSMTTSKQYNSVRVQSRGLEVIEASFPPNATEENGWRSDRTIGDANTRFPTLGEFAEMIQCHKDKLCIIEAELNHK